jgi:hypothetical protein
VVVWRFAKKKSKGNKANQKKFGLPNLSCVCHIMDRHQQKSVQVSNLNGIWNGNGNGMNGIWI